MKFLGNLTGVVAGGKYAVKAERRVLRIPLVRGPCILVYRLSDIAPYNPF